MTDFIIFLNGQYKTNELSFYKKLCRGKIKIAANGGLEFFKKSETKPHIIIGDMDSIKNLSDKYLTKIKLITFPARKDKTDSQLAIEYCLSQNAGNIDIAMPSVGELDHFIGNILLLSSDKILKWLRKIRRIRIVNAAYEIFFIRNDRIVFKKCINDIVSVLPLSKKISLTCKGTEYLVQDLAVKRGDSRSLRNRVTNVRAELIVKGEALIIHQLGKSKK